jgi:glycine C-acetyltransferase/8-amino-7-oxononanoate synthase
VFVYDHGDVEHLAWGIAQAEGRGALIATPSVFGLDGDLAPLEELVELAQRWGIRTLVDESHAIGAVGPGGRGALAEAGLEDQVDVLVGSLDTSLGSYGAFVACDRLMARYLKSAARTFMFASALPPPAVAGAVAALEELEQRPQLVERLAANSAALRAQLELEGFDVGREPTPIVSLLLGEPELAVRVSEAALARGVFAQAIRPPVVPPMSSRLRLAVMASHRAGELRAAARVLARAARELGFDPGEQFEPAPAYEVEEPDGGVFDYEARAA